ncbi:MAG: hypothetical protein CMB29_03765 [Euryarchaeota archaeon]|nr:hypothetical protein [Euryarchaeota archaeon]
MTRLVYPLTEPTTGLFENNPDRTSVEGFKFFHADEGKPLATPWQVALSRAIMLRQYQLPEGLILDCACGSGIQITAYSEILNLPVVGVELNESRARASAVNFRTVFTERGGTSLERLNDTVFVVGDGRDGDNIMSTLTAAGNVTQNVAFLHLDPARPRNSRAHSLTEMAPRLDEVFTGWKKHLNETQEGPAILLDLSPRISTNQMLEVEALVESFWPGLHKTWTWTSRGRGRIDRLALWVGCIAEPDFPRRFVRIPPDPTQPPFIMLGGEPITEVSEAVRKVSANLKRGAYLSIVDAALVESGLVDDWLQTLSFENEYVWLQTTGRRPIIYHQKRLENSAEERTNLIPISGRIVDFIEADLTLDSIDQFVEIALHHDIQRLTIRAEVAPDLQPKLQGSLDRQLARRHGTKDGFIIKHPTQAQHLICIVD